MQSARHLSRRVVITGLGVVSCCGTGKDAFWSAIRDGVSGIRMVEGFSVDHLPCRVAGQVRDFDVTDYLSARKAHKRGRFVHFGMAATVMALADSGLDVGAVGAENVGVSFGTSTAGCGNIAEEAYAIAYDKGIRALYPNIVNELPVHAVTGHISVDLGLKGPSLSSSTGCATGIITISQGFEAIRQGQARCMVAGGTEANVSSFAFDLLARQKVLSSHLGDPRQACRPFDKHRCGLVLSEGAGAVVLEAADHAMDRGAHIYGEVLGYGTSSEAYHMVLPLPEGGRELARAIRGALQMSRIAPSDVDYVCAHGIGNREYDIVDTEGVKEALGEHAYRIPVSSIKAVTGQAFGASGAFQAVAVSLAFDHQTVPPTINYETPDALCDLDYVPNVARRARIDTALMNAHSFGGAHAALVLRRFVA